MTRRAGSRWNAFALFFLALVFSLFLLYTLAKVQKKGGLHLKYCPYCGAGLDEGFAFCPKCGKPFESEKENPNLIGKNMPPETPAVAAPASIPVGEATPKKTKRSGIIALISILVVLAIVGGLFASGSFSSKEEPVLPFSDNTEAIEQASKSVVMLTCYDKDGEAYATGSGFAVFADGIIVTNYHVIEQEPQRIEAKTENGISFECSTILAYDEKVDLALLRANKKIGLALLRPGKTTELKKGEKVVAIGSPLGLLNSVSTGVFSGYIDDVAGTVLQFSAAISHGSSGGALFNNDGEVIGITFASYSDGQNLNLAVPIENAEELYNTLSSPKALTLNVYNWGDYIADGSGETFDTISAYEKWYLEIYGQEVKVNYNTFSSNEEMYNNISNGESCDVVILTDYMLARMREEGLLLPLNFDNIPSYHNISKEFHGLYYDPNDQFTVPYTYGIVGIIYNANVVDELDAVGWDLLWNEKYKGQILQFNNPRDAFGTAQYKLGLDVNSTDPDIWNQAMTALKAQAPLVKSYVMGEVFSIMESGDAAICAYYAGDFFTMRSWQANNIDLQFYYPEQTNCFVDAICIPSSCQNKELAESFIEYMLLPEPAIANAEHIFYPSPNKLVFSDDDYKNAMGSYAMEILYPDFGAFNSFFNYNAFRSLDPSTQAYMNSLWAS